MTSTNTPAAGGSSSIPPGATPHSTSGLVATPMPHPLPDIIDYKVKLLGLLPDGYQYPSGPRRWDLSTACFIKIPSEMTCYEGRVDTKGHPTLIGSGILERKYGLQVHLPTLAESERAASAARRNVKDHRHHVHSHHRVNEDDDETRGGLDDGGKQLDDDIIQEEDEEGNSSGNESGSEGSEGDVKLHGQNVLGPHTFICQGCQHNAVQNQKDNLMTKWLKNNFDPRRDVLPDIVCRRTVLTYIMTQKQPFILNAKRISFTSSQDPDRKEFKVIHVEFDYLPTLDLDPHLPGGGTSVGERSRSQMGTSKTSDGLPTSEKNFDAESYYEKPNLIGYFAGKLSCKVPTLPPESRCIRILLSAIVDGLWRQKSDPEFYSAHDLAEVKSTMDTTVVSDPKKGGNPHFFKQVRMAHAWAQCHLVGINRMMVGVHTLVPGNFAEDHEFDPAYALTSRPKRILQELWLYDVEKMPNAVKISSDEDGFRAWTPTDLKWKLYTALQQIRAQVQHSEDNVTHRFLHYFNEDFLVPLTLEELQFEWKAIHDANRTLTFRNVHMVQTSPDVIELSMEEVEQEHAEKQVDHILNTFLGLGIPIETVKVVRIVGSGRTLEVLFPYEALARRVYTTWRLFSGRNRYLPRGFEKIRVDVKRTKRQELERMRRKGSGNMFYFVAQSAPVRTGEARYTHQHHPYACYQCGGSGGAGAGYSAGPSVIQTGPMPPAPSSSSQQHQRDHGIQFILPGEHYPVPSGRHHHAHHHGHGHAHAHGKHHHGVGMTGPVASSASNVSGGGRTCPRGGAVGGGGTREEREEPWRYTQTMWR